MNNGRTHGGSPQGMKSKQVEIQWSEPEAFALIIQQTSDGERIVSAANQKEADKRESEKKQITFV